MKRAVEHLWISEDELLLDDPDLLLAEEDGISVDIAWEDAVAAEVSQPAQSRGSY